MGDGQFVLPVKLSMLILTFIFLAQILWSAQIQPASLSSGTLNREVKLQFSITYWMKKTIHNGLDIFVILFFFMYSASPEQAIMLKNFHIHSLEESVLEKNRGKHKLFKNLPMTDMVSGVKSL